MRSVEVARLNIDLKDSIYADLRAKAQGEGRSVSDVVRVLVNHWLLQKTEEMRFQEAVDRSQVRNRRGKK
jgi:predicted CopG family antitoxin